MPAGLIAESAAYSALQAVRSSAAGGPAGRPGARADTSRVTAEKSPASCASRSLGQRGATRSTGACVTPSPRRWQRRSDAWLRVSLLGDGPDFCAGGDLDEFGSRPDPALAHLIRLTRSPAMLMHRLRDRATAFLHGACLGAGIELPAFAARVHATADARIGLPEIGLGLMPALAVPSACRGASAAGALRSWPSPVTRSARSRPCSGA